LKKHQRVATERSAHALWHCNPSPVTAITGRFPGIDPPWFLNTMTALEIVKILPANHDLELEHVGSLPYRIAGLPHAHQGRRIGNRVQCQSALHPTVLRRV
jgi:hypothetical protein